MQRAKVIAIVLLGLSILTGCGGGGGNSSTEPQPPGPEAPVGMLRQVLSPQELETSLKNGLTLVDEGADPRLANLLGCKVRRGSEQAVRDGARL